MLDALTRRTVLHTALGALAAVELVRALHQPWLRAVASNEFLVFAWAVALPVTSAAASLLLIGLGRRRALAARALAADAAGLAGVFALVYLLASSGTSVAVLLALVFLTRLAPLGYVATYRSGRPWRAARLRQRRLALRLFVASNAALAAALVVWAAANCAAWSAVQCAAVERWLPMGYALATGLTLLVARGVPLEAPLARHAALWLVAPVALAFAASGGADALAGAPVVALVTGIAAQGVVSLWESRYVRRDAEIGLLVGATVLASSLALLPYVATVQPTASDEPHYLLTMQSLVRDGDLDLSNQYDRPDLYQDYYPAVLPDRHVVDVGPRQLPVRDPALPLAGAIPFALARRVGVLVLVCAVAAAFAWRGYMFLRRLAFGRDVALLAATAVALVHPAFTYTTQVYPELFGALIALAVAELLDRSPTPGRLAAASALIGALPWFSVRFWFVALGLGVVVAALALAPLRARRYGLASRRAAAGALPFLSLLAAFVLIDGALYGLPVPNAGYYAVRDQQAVLVYGPLTGIGGLLLDRAFGLLSHAPLYALAFLGAVPLLRRWRALRSPGLAALFLAWVAYLAYIGDIAYWWADGSPSSRYLLATIAFPMVALAAGIERLRGEVARLLAVVATAWTVAVTVLYALAPNLRYDLAADVRDDGGPGLMWTAVTGPFRADPGLLFPSMVRGAAVDWVLAAGWWVALALLVFVGWRRPRAS